MSAMKEKEMSLIPLGYIAWVLIVAGAVIASLPQWFIVQLHLPAGYSLIAGVPLVVLGAILLYVAWLPERRRKYPEVLERTMTPIPKYYLEEAETE